MQSDIKDRECKSRLQSKSEREKNFPVVTGKNHGAGKPAVADHT